MAATPSPTPPELQAFADARGRPAVFLFNAGDDPLFRNDVLALHERLSGNRFDELDMVIQSGGGSAHAAYQVVEMLHLHTNRWNACVPFFAKSAATLLCIGANRIVLGEHAELGPLDVQMPEEKRPGKWEYGSALNPFKTLEQLQSFALEALQSAMTFIVDRYEMGYDESLRHAVSFVEATAGPLVSRLDPDKLGAYSRELAVAAEYAQRILHRYTNWSDDKIDQLVQKLVYGYPSHEYIIDYHELHELGFEVELFDPASEGPAVRGLLPLAQSNEAFVELIEPAAAPAATVDEALANMTAATGDGDEETVAP